MNRDFIVKDSIFKYYFFEEDDTTDRYGSTSIVKKAINESNGEVYGVKIINLFEQDISKVYAELNILRNLNHPNIVKAYEAYYHQDDNYIFIVMEWMEGGELFERLQNKKMEEDEIKDIFKKVVDSVRYCHRLGLVHRDLKPENILCKSFDSNSQIKISDFGLAKFLLHDRGQKLYSTVGSSFYFAPEILSGRGYNEKCDIWSLGVILYVMLSGTAPFPTDEGEEFLHEKIRAGEFTFPDNEWKSISLGGKRLVSNLMVLDPSKRPNAEEILSDHWLSS